MGSSSLTGPAWGRSVDRGAKLLPHATREHNRALVLQTLVTHEVASRADIARETDLTRVTVSDLIADLLGEGIVEELGLRSAGRPGKPATMLRVNPAARHIVGIDLSNVGSFRAAVFNLASEKIWEHTLQTADLTGEAAAQAVIDLAKVAVEQTDAPLLGLAVASPGVIDLGGTILMAPNFGWENLPLGQRLREELGIPVHVANDANAQVMAAASLAAEGDDLMLVTIGFGVGAGILLDGMPRIGPHYAAGEIGHLVVGTDGGPRCACGKDGCLEAWVSEPNLRRSLGEATSAAGREEVLAEAGRRLGIVIAPVVGALNLTQVILSGPGDLLEGVFLRAADAAIRSRLLEASVEPFTIYAMPDAADAALRGAAAIVLAAELGIV